MSQSNSSVNDFTLTQEQIANSVKFLRSAFSAACNAYREAKREKGVKTANYVLRNLKTHEPILEKDVDLTLYYAQQDFAYIMDEIQRGPSVFTANEIKRCNDLIYSLSIK